MDDATVYSARRVGRVWRVSIAPPKATYVGGAYIVDLDAETGDVVIEDAQR